MRIHLCWTAGFNHLCDLCTQTRRCLTSKLLRMSHHLHIKVRIAPTSDKGCSIPFLLAVINLLRLQSTTVGTVVSAIDRSRKLVGSFLDKEGRQKLLIRIGLSIVDNTPIFSFGLFFGEGYRKEASCSTLGVLEILVDFD